MRRVEQRNNLNGQNRICLSISYDLIEMSSSLMKLTLLCFSSKTKTKNKTKIACACDIPICNSVNEQAWDSLVPIDYDTFALAFYVREDFVDKFQTQKKWMLS